MDRLLADRRHALARVKEERAVLKASRHRLKAGKEAQAVLQQLAGEIQNAAVRAIEVVVTRGLKAVFEKEAYEFKIRFESKRGKTEATLLFVDREGNEIDDPLGAASGAQAQLASLLLRLACLVLRRPRLRKLIVADEPLSGLHGSVCGRVRGLIEALAEEMNVQWLIITHNAELATGKIIELE